MAKIVVTTTIQDAINSASYGDIVQVPLGTGTYDEAIVLKDGVNVEFAYGTVLQYSGEDNLPTLTDGGNPVNSRVIGIERWPEDIYHFHVNRIGEGSAVVVSHPNSVIDIFYDRGDINCNAVNYPAVDAVAGTVILVGNNIVGKNDAIRIHEGATVKLGKDVDYGGGGCWSWDGYCVHNLGGVITQYGNMGNLSGMPVIRAEGGITNYCGYSDVPGIPLHQSGGIVNLGAVVEYGMNELDWCFLENTAGGDVILKTGGEELNMADTWMRYSTGADAKSISSGGGDQGGAIVIKYVEHLEGEVMTPQYCYACNPIQTTPPLNIIGIEYLKSWPEVVAPEEGRLLTATSVKQQHETKVTLDWNCPANNPKFEILRDKKVVGTTDKQTFTENVKGGKPNVKYTVRNIIPTLTPTEASVDVSLKQ